MRGNLMTNESVLHILKEAAGDAPLEEIARTRADVRAWFAANAPRIAWDRIESPVGPLLVAVSQAGLTGISFNPDEARFLTRLDPLALVQRDVQAVSAVRDQIMEYFRGKRTAFDVPVDWSRIKPFQRAVLQTAVRIPAGTVWTYRQVAQAIGKPNASRAVGQALARNPIPIVLPCHRVLASDGSLHGYAGGLERKRILLQLEGAL